MICKRNALNGVLDSFEPRVLLSASVLSVSDTDQHNEINSNASDLTASVPVFTQRITSNKPAYVDSPRAYLSVVAEDGGDRKDMIYTWTVITAPDLGGVDFSDNETNRAQRTRADFLSAGSYILQVTATNAEGRSASEQISLEVAQKPSDIRIIASDGSVIEEDSRFASPVAMPVFTAVVFDQFGDVIEAPSRIVWTSASPGEKTAYYVDEPAISLELTDRLQSHKIQVIAGNARLKFSVSTDVDYPEPPLAIIRKVVATEQPIVIGANRSADAAPEHAELDNSSSKKSGSMLYRVSNDFELKEALASVESGDTILLKSGASFGVLKLYRPETQFSETVTIRSEDPGHPAKLSYVVLNGATNVTIEDVEIVTKNRHTALLIRESSDIKIVNVLVTAELDPYTHGQSLVTGVTVSQSSRVHLIGNDFRNLGTGMIVSDAADIIVHNNWFEENLLDNADFGSNLERISIRQNTFVSAVEKLYPNHHYDNIQFWVHANATQDTRDIVIAENVIIDLPGAVESQAIFARGDYSDKNGVANPYGFVNVEVANNLIVTQQANAISFTEVDGLSIHGNTLVYSGDLINPDYVAIPGIRARLSTNVSIMDNILPDRPEYLALDSNEFHNNVRYEIQSRELASLLVNPYAAEFDIQNFATVAVPGGRVLNNSPGAFVASSGVDRPTALFTMSQNAVDGAFSYTFNASASLPMQGADLDQATYRWTFADGTQAKGQTVYKVFDQAGVQSVTLEVTDKAGRTSAIVKDGLAILDSDVLDLEFEGDLEDQTSTASKLESTGIPNFVRGTDGSSALAVGGEDGHLYLDPGESDFAGIAVTKEFSVAMSIQLGAEVDGKFVELANRHGAWNIRVNRSSGEMHLSLNGEFHRFVPPVDLLDGQWHDLVFTATEEKFTFFIGGQAAHTIELTSVQADTLFAKDGYGLAIGSSGPWESTRAAAFHLDDLFVSSSALSESQVADRHSDAALLS